LELRALINLAGVLEWYKYLIFCFSCAFLIITSLLASAIITAFPFYLLALLKARGSVGPIFNFFLGDFLEAFLALHFYRELATRSSFKDIDLLDLKSSPYTSGTLPPNRNKLCNILAFKPLTSLKGNSRGTKVTGSNTDSSLILIVEASTKSLWP
jgi:hypothetical protein